MTKDQIEKLKKELKELSTSFGQLSEKFKEAKGVDTEKENMMYDMMGNIHTRIDRLANSFYEHSYNSKRIVLHRMRTAQCQRRSAALCALRQGLGQPRKCPA